MDPLQFATLAHYLHNPEAVSALPDAPVVPDKVAHWVRSRSVAATVLRRVADLVAPNTAPVRPTLSRGRGNGLIRWDESPCRPSPTASA